MAWAGLARGPAMSIPDMRADPHLDTDVVLDALPGIGPALARRLRQDAATAPIRQAGDLRRVRGIGRRTAARLAPHLALPGAGPAAAP